MGIVNRTMDASEQKMQMDQVISTTKTGVAYPIFRAPCPMVISDARSAAMGISGTPTSTLNIQRFVLGAGLTTIAVSGALTVLAQGTSGPQQYSLPAAGSSLLQLQAGDVLVATQGGANAGFNSLYVALVVNATQDIRQWG